MSRAARAQIDTQALIHNYRLAKQLAPRSQAVAVIKANAYGHGALQVARTLAGEADAFGVACIEEAIELREGGIDKPILLLEGFFSADELALIDRYRFWTALHSDFQIRQLQDAKLSAPIHVWLKMDSGMHRLGFVPEHYRDAYAALIELPQVASVVLMSHFARADELDSNYTRQQLETFNAVTQDLDAPRSLANSPGTLAWPEAHGDWVRPGMMLYGVSPLNAHTDAAKQLKPVMTLESEVIAVRELAIDEPIGYGTRYNCTRPTRVGVVAMGYGDGYPRNAPNGTPVMVDGVETQLIGRVSMDMLTIDLTDLPAACGVGSRVEFWGKQLCANRVAEACDTIPYELVTRILPRIPRHYR